MRDRDFYRGMGECIQAAKHLMAHADGPDEMDSAVDKLTGCKEKLEEEGYNKVGEGDDRMVFRTPDDDHVVKFSKVDGIQNKTEASVWERLPPRGKKCVVPVTGIGDDGLWLEQKFASQGATDSSQVDECLHNAGWHCEDTKVANIGTIDGHIVLLDYGFACREM